MAQKTFADDFYNEVLKEADDCRNVKYFAVHTKGNNTIAIDNTIAQDSRLSTVGVTDKFITMSDVRIIPPEYYDSGMCNNGYKANSVMIPHNAVDYIEVDYYEGM